MPFKTTFHDDSPLLDSIGLLISGSKRLLSSCDGDGFLLLNLFSFTYEREREREWEIHLSYPPQEETPSMTRYCHENVYYLRCLSKLRRRQEEHYKPSKVKTKHFFTVVVLHHHLQHLLSMSLCSSSFMLSFTWSYLPLLQNQLSDQIVDESELFLL